MTRFIPPKLQITIALLSLTVSLIFLASSLGLLPDDGAARQPLSFIINAGSTGLGVRGNVEAAPNRPGERWHWRWRAAFSELAGVRQGWRANLIASAVY